MGKSRRHHALDEMVRQIGEAAQTVADLAGEHVARPEVEAADEALAAATDAIQDIVCDPNGADLAAAAAAWRAIASAQDTVAAAQAAVARARGQWHVAHEQRARASRMRARLYATRLTAWLDRWRAQGRTSPRAGLGATLVPPTILSALGAPRAAAFEALLAELQTHGRWVTVLPAVHAPNGYLVSVEPGQRAVLIRPNAPDDEWAEQLCVLRSAIERT
jgi:hypothetical protein